MLVDFCLPIKNEEKILGQNLDRLLGYCRTANFNFSWRVVGVVNGSNDNSVKILQEFKLKYPDEVDYFEVMEPGRGGALKKYWTLSSADVVSYMDADLAVSLKNLIHLIEPIINNTGDVVIGSRLLSESKIRRSVGREIISQSYNFISRLMLNYRAADLQCGFKAVRTSTFKAITPWLQDNFWFFDTELVVLAQRLGYRVKEIPVDWEENRYDKRTSTVKVFRDSLLFLKNLWRFRCRLRGLKKFLDNV